MNFYEKQLLYYPDYSAKKVRQAFIEKITKLVKERLFKIKIKLDEGWGETTVTEQYLSTYYFRTPQEAEKAIKSNNRL